MKTSRKHLMTRTLMPRVARGGAMAVVAAAALAGASAAAAAPPPAGVISTVAGNVGGPAKATNVAVTACGVAYAGGVVRIADGPTVRAVNVQTDLGLGHAPSDPGPPAVVRSGAVEVW